MNSMSSPSNNFFSSDNSESRRSEVKSFARSLGFESVGFARIEPVAKESIDNFRQWIACRRNGDMAYLERYEEIREDPALLLADARTMIVVTLNYYPHRLQSPNHPQFAYYAYGNDYHDVMRRRLLSLGDYIRQKYGGNCRPCVDTAPICERYWAVKAGLGFIGKNSQLIIPGKGSYFFLGEIITTVDFYPDQPCTLSCGDCNECVKACPGAAIRGNCQIDARKCLSYLTIEHRGVFPSETHLGNHVYGCDECQKACPLNKFAQPTEIAEFAPSEKFLNLDRNAILTMTPERFSDIFRHSAVKRTKLEGLRRNAAHLDK